MNILSDEDKLFIFMNHAEELQKIATASHKELQAASAAIKEMAEGLPVELQGAMAGSLAAIAESRLVNPVKQAGSELCQIMISTKAATKGLWIYPIGIMAFILIFLSGYAYWGLNWMVVERDRAKDELAAINYELAKMANVTSIGNEDGYWVEIDKSKKFIEATNDKVYAKMPRQ